LNKRNEDIQLLANFLQPQFPVEIQHTALNRLRNTNQKEVAQSLVAAWKASSPNLRSEILNCLLTRREWTQALLVAMEEQKIPANHIGTIEQQKLRKNNDKAIRERAAKLLTYANEDRRKVVESFRGVESLQGHVTHGSALFQQNCVTCHAGADSKRVGPDLGAMANKSVQTLLEAILDPNRAVEARYVNYVAVKKDGSELNGVLVAETANSITLRSPNGEETILRSNLAQLTSSGLSLMPEGFEKIFSAQDLADLIAWLMKPSQEIAPSR
jgi:putative heme-binding domain-containing protein